jgi:hypothetical protein
VCEGGGSVTGFNEVQKNGHLSTTVAIKECGMTFKAGDSALVVYDNEGRVFDWCRFVRGRHPRSREELAEAAWEWLEEYTASCV